MAIQASRPHSWIELSRNALAHNLRQLQSVVGTKVVLAPAVKANAYGHGLAEVVSMLSSIQGTALCVNSAFELEAVRHTGFAGDVLVLGPLLVTEIPSIIENKGTPFVYGTSFIRELQKAAQSHGDVPVILLIDSGMTRDGARAKQIPERFQQIEQSSALQLQGLATHFATADEPHDQELFNKQLKVFRALEDQIDPRHTLPLTTLGNSATTLFHPEAHGKLVRPGISFYGLPPSPEVAQLLQVKGIVLRPVLSWKTHLVKVTPVGKGSSISYGATYTTKRDSRIGLLPIGYYDSYDRHLSNTGQVLIRGKRAPIVGRVCMNMCMVDVTDIPEAQAGDEVVLIGAQGNQSITADELAEKIGTINYEVVTRLPEHISRQVVQ